MMVTLSRATPYSIIYELYQKNQEFSFFLSFFFSCKLRHSNVFPFSSFPTIEKVRRHKRDLDRGRVPLDKLVSI